MTNCDSSKDETDKRILTDLGINIEGDFPDEIGGAIIYRALYSTNEKS